MKNLCYHLEVSIISLLLYINVYINLLSTCVNISPRHLDMHSGTKPKISVESLFLKFVYFYCTTKCGLQYKKVSFSKNKIFQKSEIMFLFISVLN